uniref:Uncharacterized protein n=1 Tax=Sphaerodactylus townsendi TaxID=933632 RepID=A0ACB8EEX2_9SAUR
MSVHVGSVSGVTFEVYDDERNYSIDFNGSHILYYGSYYDGKMIGHRLAEEKRYLAVERGIGRLLLLAGFLHAVDI